MVAKFAKRVEFTDEEPLHYYLIPKEELDVFVNQLCKEQRENDIAEIKGAVLFAKNSLNESIQDLMINAVKKSKQPEV